MNERMLMNIVTVVVLTIVIVFANGIANGQTRGHYGKVNTSAINTGNLQLKGVLWCKKYFDTCVVRESWMGPTLQSRDTATVSQYVTMMTGITNPDIREVKVMRVNGGNLRITFVYDHRRLHENWVPEFR